MKHLEGLSVLIVLALGLAVAGFLALEALATRTTHKRRERR